MIDALFGSKTRVKLLHLFMNNTGQSFYVREITRKIDEQINSVRRELANMLNIGVITSDNVDNKLYYQVNQRYEYFIPLKAIFSDDKSNLQNSIVTNDKKSDDYKTKLQSINGVRIAIFSGILISNSAAPIDILLAGDISQSNIKWLISEIERNEGREICYSVISYDEFYYRLSIRDKFITEILNNRHEVVVDEDKVLTRSK